MTTRTGIATLTFAMVMAACGGGNKSDMTASPSGGIPPTPPPPAAVTTLTIYPTTIYLGESASLQH